MGMSDIDNTSTTKPLSKRERKRVGIGWYALYPDVLHITVTDYGKSLLKIIQKGYKKS